MMIMLKKIRARKRVISIFKSKKRANEAAHITFELLNGCEDKDDVAEVLSKTRKLNSIEKLYAAMTWTQYKLL